MDPVGAILDIIKSIWTSSAKCVKYHRGLNENMKTLEDKLEELNCRKSDIESETRPELHPGQILKQEVDIWLKKVQEFNDDKHLQQKFEKVKFLSRAYLGRKVAKKIAELEKHHQKSSSFSDGLMVDAPPCRGEMFPTTRLGGKTAADKMEEIWTSLVSDDVQRIGVHGMGGSGKSTIMKHIHNRILESHDKFDHVYWITVSKATSVIKLQDGIARALGFKGLDENEGKERRAAKLCTKLKEKKRCVLIFDDMWEHFNLEEVGIPEPTVGCRCKLILTTRLLDVCRRMNCSCVKMELLSDNEAWDLFLEKVGRDMTSEVKPIAKLVAKECARLPLAIIAIGTSMKGVDDKHEWRNTLKKLRNSTKGLVEMEKIIKQLTVSYDQLEDEKAQRCLLYCALYPEDYKITRQELIPLLIAEEIIEGMESSREEGFDEGHALLNKLENACLLESCTNYDFGYGIRRKCVIMHDVIRDMALQIMGDESMVEARLRLSEFPSKEKWTEVLEVVSLMDNNIEEIPVDASPRCSKLKTLLLSENRSLKMIPDSFFVHMPSLSVLDLSDSSIEKLPNSIADLENLTALMLRRCFNLYYVPSLAKLRRLRMLDLSYTKIEEVPEGMEMLANLQYLNLFIEALKTFPTGILPKLTRLQCLILYWGSKNHTIKGEELIGLKKLERLVCKFYDPNDFNWYVRSLEHHQRRLPKSYYLYVGSLRYGDPGYVDDEDKHQKSVGYGIQREGKAESKSEESILLPNDVEDLRIQYCDDVRSLSDVRVQLLSNLEVLWLTGLKNLCAASSHSPLLLHCTFSCLRDLSITFCRNIKRLFTPGLVPHLQNLEEIKVWGCEEMEEIVAEEEEEEEGMIKNDHNFSITLPKLKTLSLYKLPELKCIMCRRGVMVCDSIETIRIVGCPKVKRLPLYLPLNPNGQPSPPPLLTSIFVGRWGGKWWNLLEWDNPISKDVLQPFIKFSD